MRYNGLQRVTKFKMFRKWNCPLAFVFDFEYFFSEMGYNGLQQGTRGYNGLQNLKCLESETTLNIFP